MLPFRPSYGLSHSRRPKTWTAADRHYERLRIHMLPLFEELGLAA